MKRRYISVGRRHSVFLKCDGMCARCGSKNDLTIDHVIPLSRGGTYDLRNLVLLCKKCNEGKGDTLIIPSKYYLFLNKESLLKVESYYLDHTRLFYDNSSFYRHFIESLE